MGASFKFLMPSHPRFLPVVRACVLELGSTYGFADPDSRAMVLAIDEAVANVIRHAYHGQHDQPVEVNCRVLPDSLEFTLLDEGEAPDPARICGQPLNDTSFSGRGTHLIRMIMDEMVYEQVGGRNQLRMVKRLPESRQESAE